MQMAVLEGESKYLGGNKRRETCFGRSDRQVASRESDDYAEDKEFGLDPPQTVAGGNETAYMNALGKWEDDGNVRNERHHSRPPQVPEVKALR